MFRLLVLHWSWEKPCLFRLWKPVCLQASREGSRQYMTLCRLKYENPLYCTASCHYYNWAAPVHPSPKQHIYSYRQFLCLYKSQNTRPVYQSSTCLTPFPKGRLQLPSHGHLYIFCHHEQKHRTLQDGLHFEP